MTNGNPAPDGYLLAARRLNSRPEHCVICEDTLAGILAGRAAGMSVLALLTTWSPEHPLDADCITSFDKVRFLFEEA